MTDGRGRHSRGSGPQFYKDVLLLVAGILIVAAVVFGGMSLLAGGDDAETTTTSAPTSPQVTAVDTTSPPTTSTPPTSPPTSTPTTTPGTTGTSAPGTTVREVRVPADVRVVVLNSTQQAGIAGALTDELSNLGYQTSEAANYTPELSDTMIFHADGFAREAANLAEVVGDGTLAPDPDLTAAQGVDVVVVIGLSYQG